MGYAVLQRKLQGPTTQQLVEAFAAVPRLVGGDARWGARHRIGILADGLDAIEANTLLQSLTRLGVSAAVVNEDDLPVLEAPRKAKRLDCLVEHLLLYDGLGRPQPVVWERVSLVAAGIVPLSQQVRGHMATVEYDQYQPVQVEIGGGSQMVPQVVVEIHLEVEPRRVQLLGSQMLFHYLGLRRSAKREENVAKVVKDLADHASRAMLNRGAAAVSSASGQFTRYESRRAFETEMVWLTWWSRQGGE